MYSGLSSEQGIAISGYGCICAAGATAPEAYQAVGLGLVNTQVLGEGYFTGGFSAPCFIADDSWLEPARQLFPDVSGNRTLLLALIALSEALERANLAFEDLQGRRVGLVLGTTVGCTFHNEEYYRLWRQGNKPDQTPVDSYLRSNLAARLQTLLGVKGPRAVITNACASGTDAIGMAKAWLNSGMCDIAVCGGADELSRIASHGFRSLMLVSPENCRPFDQNRQGLNLGEGSGIFILERNEDLLRRGQKGYGWVRGYGAAGDAYHPTAPHPDGRGLQQAVRIALAESRQQPGDIAMINAHGTGTPANDRAETGAVSSLGFNASNTPMVSTKGATGHTLGAAGGVEAVFTLLALNTGVLHGTVGCHEPDPEFQYKVVAQGKSVRVCGTIGLSQSLAFGGGNSALIIEGAGK